MKKKLLKNLVDELVSINNNNQMKKILTAILTPKELEDIPIRLEILKLLKKGVSQREIAEKLGVGIATITRGSREIKTGNY